MENYKDEYDRQIKVNKKQKCPSCGKLRVLDEETDVCKDCSEDYE